MSESKLRKTDKKMHFGRGGRFLKSTMKLKRVGFYNASSRLFFKKELRNSLIE